MPWLLRPSHTDESVNRTRFAILPDDIAYQIAEQNAALVCPGGGAFDSLGQMPRLDVL